MHTAEQAAWYANVLLAALLLVRLLTAGLARRYPWFIAYLVSSVASSLVLLTLPVSSWTYFRAFLAVELLLLLLEYLAVRECLEHLKASYPGAAPPYLRNVTGWACTVAVGLCAVSIVPDAAALHWGGVGRSLASLFLLADRSVNSALALSMLAVQVWTVRYPSNRAPNLTRHMRLLTCYLGTGAAIYLALNLRLAAAPVLSVVQLSAYCVWFALWCGMSRAGESPPALEPITPEECNTAWGRLLAIGKTARDAAAAVRRKRVIPPEWER